MTTSGKVPAAGLLSLPVQKIWKYDRGSELAGAGLRGNVAQFFATAASLSSATSLVPRHVSADLEEFKVALNKTKSLLNRFEIGKWGAHTSRTQPFGDVVSCVSHSFNPELCTNAWCKMYEILATFGLDLLPEAHPSSEKGLLGAGRSAVTSVHLCEAPGAFVCALNHYLKITAGASSEHAWLASTLNPWYEGNQLGVMINDDRFIKQTYDHWCFGEDQSGDILTRDNIDYIANDCRLRLSQVNLVTADGGFNCQDEPAEQEHLVYPLIAAEIYTALLVLAEGGALVLKTFTAFETGTTVLLYLLNIAFKEVTIFKPNTSKPGNSEVYTVCRGYCGSAAFMTEDARTAFMAAIERGLPVLPPDCLPPAFIMQHVACCRAFKNWQEETILNNICLYEMPWSCWRNQARELRQQCCSLYLQLCSLQPISEEQKITGNSMNKKLRLPVSCSRKRLSGSYEKRQLYSSSDSCWKSYVEDIGFYNVPRPLVLRWLTARGGHSDLCWLIVEGKRLGAVESSRFCDADLVDELLSFARCTLLRGSSSPTSSTCGTGLNDDVVQLVMASIRRTCSDEKSAAVKGSQPSVDAVADAIQDTAVVETQPLLMATPYDWLELQHREHLLSAVLAALKCLNKSVAVGTRDGECSDTACKPGDAGAASDGCATAAVILPFSTLLTRFSVNCLYVLWSCFDEIATVFHDGTKADGQPTGPILHLVCKGYIVSVGTASFERHLQDVADALSACKKSSRPRDVLEFIPITTILDDDEFMAFLLATNRQAVKRLINYLLTRERSTRSSCDSLCAYAGETPNAGNPKVLQGDMTDNGGE